MAYHHRATGLVYLANPRTASRSTARALVEQCGFNVVEGHHAPWRYKEHPDMEVTTFCVVRDLLSTLRSWGRRYGKPWPKFLEEGFDGQRPIIRGWENTTLFPFEREADHVLVFDPDNMDKVISDFLAEFGLGPVKMRHIR